MRSLLFGIVAAVSLVPCASAQQSIPPIFLGIRGGAVAGGQTGAVVAEVIPGGTAAAIGIQPGDRIIEANGRPIASSEAMQGLTRTLRPGDRLQLKVVRGAETVTLAGLAQAMGAPASGGSVAAITPAMARSTAIEFARLLEEDYLDPAIGTRYAQRLREKAAAGAFDQAGSAGALAAMLSDEVQAVAPDTHLRLMAGEGPDRPQMRRVPAGGSRAEGPAAIGSGQPLEDAREIAPGVLYLRFSSFPNDPAVAAAATAFLDRHQNARSVIFDIRGHRGGSTDIMDALFAYLFAEETVLVRTDARESVSRRMAMQPPTTIRRVAGPAGIVREEHVAFPHPTKSGLKGAKVFVLTSRSTASAAEHFALALKASGRATLIGGTTRGAGNFALGGMRSVGNGFSAFIPSGRTYDPRSGKGWEGTGVEPDILVDPQAALVEALIRSGMARDKAEALGRP